MAKNDNVTENNTDILSESLNLDNIESLDLETEKESKALNLIITALIVLIWIIVLIALIKLDVGGFGSKVMRPVLKDVPGLNKLLPEADDSEVLDDVPYQSLAEAATYIKELEQQLAAYQETENNSDTTIAELQAEVARLQQFEAQQKAFEEEKAKYYREVVFGEKAIDEQNFIDYYKTIDAENAEKLYQEAISRYAYNETLKERAKYYSSMKPASAAKIFSEMTGDLDIVVSLLNCMNAKQSGDIIAAIGDIDSVLAAKITKMIVP